MTVETKPITPMMIQWQELKKEAKAALLLFRLGDFYEGFCDDAKILSKELDLVLTKRGETPMAGLPYHAAEAYIDLLISKGYRVAIAEQTEEAKPGKGLVKREIVRVLSPATYIGPGQEKSNSYFASLFPTGLIWGLSFVDITTGEFKTTEFDSFETALSEITSLKPKEILTSYKVLEKHHLAFQELKESFSPLLTLQEEWRFELSLTHSALCSHYKIHSLDGFGLKGMTSAVNSSGALLSYIKDELCETLEGLEPLKTYSNKEYLKIDPTSEKNLELIEPFEAGRKTSLLSVLDYTLTPMGARLIRTWIRQPLLNLSKIEARQKALSSFIQNSKNHERLTDLLTTVKDLERLTIKLTTNYASPRDLLTLALSLKPIPEIKSLVSGLSASLLAVLANELTPLESLVKRLEGALVEDPPLRLTDGGIFKWGFNKELDELKKLSSDSKDWMANYQATLKESTGIKTLKVGFTKVSGFYIEVSRGQSEKVPDHFQRRQTLTNAERYVTADLKHFEEKVLTAEDKALRLELELFNLLKEELKPHVEVLLRNAHALAQLDALSSLSLCARKHGYVCPTMDESNTFEIISGRHPVVEAMGHEPFIPNDTHLNKTERLMLITGPNMAGKSTYIRQNALIAIMAQIGSFVPAKSARIGLIDRVFTRIGASDDLSRGKSTFMVEMTETANILNNATDRSLVILDEIGRGTSTYDGIAIAWSVAEYLLITEGKKAKTLFATHFWELTKLEEKVAGAVNYTIAVHEDKGEITFLRKIIKGGTDKSYGIHVAKWAGLPSSVISRAHDILSHLEENSQREKIFEPGKPRKGKGNPDQLHLF